MIHNPIGAKVIWFTGLSSSGKTTLGELLAKELKRYGHKVVLLDGDIIRKGINSDLAFSLKDREENIRRVAEVSKLFLLCGLNSICCFISPTEKIRDVAKSIIGRNNFIEIYLNTPIEVCEKRDLKGLYRKARRKEIENFTGIDAMYEEPVYPDFILDTSKYSVEESVNMLAGFIKPLLL